MTHKSLRQNRMSAPQGNFAKTIQNTLLFVPEAMLRIFPDALFWGVGFFAFVTLSYSFGVFFLSLVEAILIFYALHYGNENLQIVSTNALGKGSKACSTGFTDVTMRAVSLFNMEFKPSFLSSHLFMTGVISSYLLSVILYFRSELEILGSSYGEQYNTRLYGSTIFFSIIIFLAMSYRMFNQCDSVFNIIISLILGLTAGALIAVQNNGLLGIESLNLLGVPILRKRTANGGDLYVCSPNT